MFIKIPNQEVILSRRGEGKSSGDLGKRISHAKREDQGLEFFRSGNASRVGKTNCKDVLRCGKKVDEGKGRSMRLRKVERERL